REEECIKLGEVEAKEKGKGEENVERILGMGKKGRGILGNRRKRRKRTLGEEMGEQDCYRSRGG
ncbi:hypothetical protein C7212DRAFT_336845, partial [Tuber magnatum]